MVFRLEPTRAFRSHPYTSQALRLQSRMVPLCEVVNENGIARTFDKFAILPRLCRLPPQPLAHHRRLTSGHTAMQDETENYAEKRNHRQGSHHVWVMPVS